jgi:hypothetical protein
LLAPARGDPVVPDDLLADCSSRQMVIKQPPPQLPPVAVKALFELLAQSPSERSERTPQRASAAA